MSNRKTRIEIWNEGEKFTRRWIEVLCGFLQGDSYSPFGFCIFEIPACKLLQQSKGYRLGENGNRNVRRIHRFLADDLMQYQESHKVLKDMNDIIVQAGHNTGACYLVSKWAGIVFEDRKMVRGERLSVLDKSMQTMDPDENKIYM